MVLRRKKMDINNVAEVSIVDEVVETAEVKPEETKANEKSGEFKFFKCCSASLKRFSVVMFVINLFLAVAITAVAIVLLAVYVGVGMLGLLALPLITLFIILVVVSRFVSALIYGFAEIVEKNETK